MTRKSRKPQNLLLTWKPSPVTVGYIRLSSPDKDRAGSVENQRLIIEEWGRQHQTPIFHYYIDNGVSGRVFNRPAWNELLRDIHDGKIEYIIVKDLSRLGRDYLAVGYYIESFFPSHSVRFVSVNDRFDTVDGITNLEIPCSSRMTVPIRNLLNERISIELKKIWRLL